MFSGKTYGMPFISFGPSQTEEEGGSLKRVTSTHERGNLHSIKGSSQTII